MKVNASDEIRVEGGCIPRGTMCFVPYPRKVLFVGRLAVVVRLRLGWVPLTLCAGMTCGRELRGLVMRGQ